MQIGARVCLRRRARLAGRPASRSLGRFPFASSFQRRCININFISNPKSRPTSFVRARRRACSSGEKSPLFLSAASQFIRRRRRRRHWYSAVSKYQPASGLKYARLSLSLFSARRLASNQRGQWPAAAKFAALFARRRRARTRTRTRARAGRPANALGTQNEPGQNCDSTE